MSEERRTQCFGLSMADYVNSLCKSVYNCNTDAKINELVSLQDIEVYGVGYIGSMNKFFKECADDWKNYVDTKTLKDVAYNVFWVVAPTVSVEDNKYRFRARLAIKENV